MHSFLKTQPEELPEHLEAGTLNGHGIAGLLAGVQEIQKITAEEIWKKERNLMECFVARIKQIPNVKIYGDFSDKNRCPIVSLNIAGVDSSQVSEWLLEEYEIAVRSGAHCAPLMHHILERKSRAWCVSAFRIIIQKRGTDGRRSDP